MVDMDSEAAAVGLAAHLTQYADTAPACPDCGETGTWTFRPKLRPTGGSVAGAQVKFSCFWSVFVECSGCGWQAWASEDD